MIRPTTFHKSLDVPTKNEIFRTTTKNSFQFFGLEQPQVLERKDCLETFIRERIFQLHVIYKTNRISNSCVCSIENSLEYNTSFSVPRSLIYIYKTDKVLSLGEVPQYLKILIICSYNY